MKFSLRLSRFLTLLLLVMHLIVGVVAYLTFLPLLLKVLISVMLISSFLYYLARDALLRLPHSWCEISLDQRMANIRNRDDTLAAGEVIGTSFINPYFVILRIKLDCQQFVSARIIFFDALPKEQFRQFRVLLRSL